MKLKITIALFASLLLSCTSDTNLQHKLDSSIKGVAFWGDSMTRGAEGVDINIADVVAQNLSLNVYNFGNGGFNSNQVATIQGGKPLYLKLLNNEILPFNVGNTIITEYNILLFNAVSEQIIYGTLNGVKGYLIRIPDILDYNLTERMEFVRLDAANTFIQTPNEVKFLFDSAENHKDNIAVIWVGRNNERTVTEISNIKNDIASMINHLQHPKKFLIISLCNATFEDEKRGTNKYRIIQQLNKELSLIYSERFLDLRKYMINNAIFNSTIIPTSQDINDINSDCIPRSLLYDLVHFNDVGYLLAGNFIGEKLADLYTQ